MLVSASNTTCFRQLKIQKV